MVKHISAMHLLPVHGAIDYKVRQRRPKVDNMLKKVVIYINWSMKKFAENQNRKSNSSLLHFFIKLDMT